MNLFASLRGLEFASPTGSRAEDRLLAALVRRGSYDRHDFFLPRSMIQYPGREGAVGAARASSLRFHNTASIPGRLAAEDWSVLYADLATGAYVRDAFARRPFPIVWRVEGRDLAGLERTAPTLLLSNLGRHDAIVHASAAEREAIERVLESARAALERATGRRLPFEARFVPLGPEIDPFVGRSRLRPAGERPVVVLTEPDGRVPRAVLLLMASLWPAIAGRPRLVVRTVDPAPALRLVRSVGLGEDDVSVLEAAPLPESLAGADLLVTSLETGQGAARFLLEAQVLGLPVVAPDDPIARGSVLPGRTALLVPFRSTLLGGAGPRRLLDPIALGDAIGRLVASPEKARRMGRTARRWASREGDPDRVAAALDDLCRELIAECGREPVRPGRPDRPGLGVACGGYFDSFRWNFSEILAGDTRLETTALGTRAIEGRHAPAVYTKLDAYFRPTLVGDILSATVAGATLDSIVEKVGDVDQATFHTLWMMKHGLLAIAGRTAAAPAWMRRVQP